MIKFLINGTREECMDVLLYNTYKPTPIKYDRFLDLYTIEFKSEEEAIMNVIKFPFLKQI